MKNLKKKNDISRTWVDIDASGVAAELMSEFSLGNEYLSAYLEVMVNSRLENPPYSISVESSHINGLPRFH